MKEKVTLTTGSGFSGSHYTMKIGGDIYELEDCHCREDIAHAKAVEICKTLGVECPDRFEWDGTL